MDKWRGMKGEVNQLEQVLRTDGWAQWNIAGAALATKFLFLTDWCRFFISAETPRLILLNYTTQLSHSCGRHDVRLRSLFGTTLVLKILLWHEGGLTALVRCVGISIGIDPLSFRDSWEILQGFSPDPVRIPWGPRKNPSPDYLGNRFRFSGNRIVRNSSHIEIIWACLRSFPVFQDSRPLSRFVDIPANWTKWRRRRRRKKKEKKNIFVVEILLKFFWEWNFWTGKHTKKNHNKI